MKSGLFKDFREFHFNQKNEILEKKKEITPNFNLVNLISPKELQLSKIIAEFLNPNGSHEQGDLFLKTFIKKFYKKIKFPYRNITVQLEVAEHVEGQIDIIIDFDNKFGIAIENKPFAEDQDKQIMRYVEYLETKYSNNYLMIYLSSLGQKPSNKSISQREIKRIGSKFSILSYLNIKDWLKDCSETIELKKSLRLNNLVKELIEYINLEFLQINKLNDKMLGHAIKDNILEAYEIKEFWKNDKQNLDNLWNKTVNYLFNKTLPRLIFEELKNREVINQDWKYIEGDFDVKKNSVKGFYFKKNEWNHFSYGILKNQIKNPTSFFPAICSKLKSENYKFEVEFLEKCHFKTKTKKTKEQWFVRPTIWWSDFPEPFFKKWSYEQWSEIKEGGKTVNYLSNFFEILIKESVKELENEERRF